MQDNQQDAIRRLVRHCRQASLACLGDAAVMDGFSAGYPAVSLVMLGHDACGYPLLQLSDLALHSKLLAANPRVSLLVSNPASNTNPLVAARATIFGEMQMISDEAPAYDRYCSLYPDAADFRQFKDFKLYRLLPERIHWVAGFGQIKSFTQANFTLGEDHALPDAVVQAAIAHMMADHQDQLAGYAALAGAPPATAAWQLVAIDADGMDLLAGTQHCRVDFAEGPVTPTGLRAAFVALSQRARPQPAGRDAG